MRRVMVVEMVRRSAVASALALVLLMSADFDGSPLSSPAQAQEEEGKKREPKGRRVEALSQQGYEVIVEAQKQMEAENYGGAAAALGRIISSPGNFKGIDVATAYKFRGYAYAGQDNYAAAAKDFESAINTGALPDFDVSDLRYNLAQLYLGLDQYGKAVQYLEEWLRTAENPGASALFFAAQVYLVTENLAKAETYADQGVAKAQALGQVQENWYRIASVVYLQRDRWEKARPILERLVVGWPDKKDYYFQLGAVYTELGREKDSFAMLALAYENSLPLTSDEHVRLAQLYRLYEYPYKAGKILEKGLSAGTVKSTKTTWEELGNAWFQAREMKKAIDPLTKAADLATDGDIALRLCQTHLQDENWERAERECGRAVNKGGLKSNAGLAHQLLGISRYEQGERDSAIEAFNKCQDFEQAAENCLSWSRHIREEIAMEEAEKERQRLAAEEAERRRQEQEEQIQSTIRSVGDVFGEGAVGTRSGTRTETPGEDTAPAEGESSEGEAPADEGSEAPAEDAGETDGQ